ncbi:N-6 DNA methylase [bacterium]|nr:N-6 DNA methylase [bacterium]
MKKLLEQYLKHLTDTTKRGDAREESYYKHLNDLIKKYTEIQKIKNIDITILPKKTEAGNPDFRIWDGKNHITGYIEAKNPSVTNLDYIEGTEQLKRYCSTFPNIILTNFHEFRLYRDGQRIAQAMIGRPIIAQKLKTPPPLENVEKFKELFETFFSFSLPKVQTARSLAIELAKRTRFLRDEVIAVEIDKTNSKGHKQIIGFYEAFKKYLIGTLTEKQFADLYAQTITYGLFASRTRSPIDGEEFNRRVAFDYIPHTIGILRDVFRFISLEEPPKALQIMVEDIAEILQVTDVNKILHEYRRTGKGRDPIIHFYETFLVNYDPEIRERRGVYYTPEAVVSYIVRSIHSLLKSHFGLADGLANKDIKLLDPAGGTLTFPAEAIRLAAAEFKEKFGAGGLQRWISKHILANFYAFELMMAPYAIGHLKMGFIFDELGYKMADNERFKLYLTNTLEMEEIEQIAIPGLSSLSEESHLASKVKKEQPVLVILGNPPYSGISANINKWTEQLLKEDIDGTQSYYKVDEHPLGEKKLWLQDDYVKFLRFAQWKIQTSGYGIVGMITNHSYLDNPTFRGMRQSLTKTFDEIYILDLHGNNLKKEITPEGGKDENVFDIRQGVMIALFIKNKKAKKPRVFHMDKYGLREEKYDWLDNNEFNVKNYHEIIPTSPWYFFIPRNTSNIQRYLEWERIDEIFPVNVTGIVTARDKFVIGFNKNEIRNRILQFRNLALSDEIIEQAYNLKDTRGWKISSARKKLSEDLDWDSYYQKFLYRPFDIRTIYYTEKMVDWGRPEYMRHMLKKNIGLITPRQFKEEPGALVTENIIGHKTVSAYDINYLFPLYLYPDKNKKDLFNQHQTEKEPNISQALFEKLKSVYKKKPTPEEILYYVYGVFYSNIYRETYAEFLKIDFPRVPFTVDYVLFKKMGKMGKELADLHLLKSPLLDLPVAKYQGSGSNDCIEKIIFNEKEQRIYINKDKYFEGVVPKVWHYHIGGYQVLQKYLKDRKGRSMDDAPYYCRIVTALSKTIKIQKMIDEIYPKMEKIKK